MATLRTHIVLPAQLAKDIDELAGPRGRSAFLVETAENEVRRRKMLTFLDIDAPTWRDQDKQDTPDVDAAGWVHNLRRQRSGRQDYLDKLANEIEPQ